MRNHTKSGRKGETIFFSLCGVALLVGVIAVIILSTQSKAPQPQENDAQENSVSVYEKADASAADENESLAFENAAQTKQQADGGSARSTAQSAEKQATTPKSTKAPQTAEQENARYQNELDALKKEFAAEYSRLIDLQTQAETSMRDEHKAIAQLNEQLIGEAEKGVNDPDYQSPIEDQLNRQIKAHQDKAKEYAAQYTKYQNDLEKLEAQYNENVQAAEKRHQENLKKLS
ncbi:MAG: hypothetical protein KH282_06200 [Clostridiales bacterium]|nr:hypothetical protein [Clostridiales bacterium]